MSLIIHFTLVTLDYDFKGQGIERHNQQYLLFSPHNISEAFRKRQARGHEL